MLEIDCKTSGKILVVGHRGVRFQAPENTMTSFQLGFEGGADTMELDIHLSKDKQLVVIHDYDVSRTTDGKGVVGDFTLKELKKLDAGVKFDKKFINERIPTLDEVLDWAKGKIDLVIEIKGDPQPSHQIEELLIKKLYEREMQKNVMVISFFHTSVLQIKNIDPNIATGLLFICEFTDPVKIAELSKADSLRPSYQYWTKESVARVHQAGLHVHAWPANDIETIKYLIDLGVDSFGSDYPKLSKEYLHSRDLSLSDNMHDQ